MFSKFVVTYFKMHKTLVAFHEQCHVAVNENFLTNQMWFSMVCTLIDNEYVSSQSKCCRFARCSSRNYDFVVKETLPRFCPCCC